MYIPPFSVSAEAINLITEISGQIERYAITASTNVGQSGPFIDFMLNEIFKTLKQNQGESLPLASDSNPIDKEFGIKFGEEFGIKFGIKFGINDKSLLLLLNSNPSSTAADAAEQLGMTQRGAEVEIRSVSKKAFRKDKNKKWKNWNRGSNGTCTSKNPFVRIIYTPMINVAIKLCLMLLIFMQLSIKNDLTLLR